MTYLKSISDTISTWPTWKKVAVGFIAFAIVNAIVNPAPKQTEAQKAAIAAQKATEDAARDAERKQENSEHEAVALAHQWVEASLNDPGSVEWNGTRVYRNLDVCVEFSAKNGFNGRVKGFATVLDGNLTINNVKAWNKRCGDSGSVRYY